MTEANTAIETTTRTIATTITMIKSGESDGSSAGSPSCTDAAVGERRESIVVDCSDADVDCSDVDIDCSDVDVDCSDVDVDCLIGVNVNCSDFSVVERISFVVVVD